MRINPQDAPSTRYTPSKGELLLIAPLLKNFKPTEFQAHRLTSKIQAAW